VRAASRAQRKPHARPKLLAVDLDGTLLDRKTGMPHASDLDALRALAQTGVPISIVTGRLYSGTRPTAELVGLRGPQACADGSHVVRALDHATLVHHGIAGSHAHAIRDALAESGAATFVFAQDAIAHDDRGEPFLGYVSTWSTDVRRTEKIIEHDFWSHEQGITAVVAVGTEHQIAQAAVAIARDLAGVAQVVTFPVWRMEGGHHALIARAAAGTKGSALAWIAEHHGIDIEETVCVGDWLNDVPMLETAGRSFAMGHAPDAVKAAATDILEESQDTGGGVARAIAEAFGVRPQK
jgi:Cof subfamily protein (haloacid dehalogenase superfamily)